MSRTVNTVFTDGELGYSVSRRSDLAPGRPIDTETVVKIGKELVRGRGASEVARIVGCSEKNVRNWRRRLGLDSHVQRDPRVSPREGDVVKMKDEYDALALPLRVEAVRHSEVFVSTLWRGKTSFWAVKRSEWCPVLADWKVVEKGGD